jgi:hypothetical protein
LLFLTLIRFKKGLGEALLLAPSFRGGNFSAAAVMVDDCRTNSFDFELRVHSTLLNSFSCEEEEADFAPL